MLYRERSFACLCPNAVYECSRRAVIYTGYETQSVGCSRRISRASRGRRRVRGPRIAALPRADQATAHRAIIRFIEKPCRAMATAPAPAPSTGAQARCAATSMTRHSLHFLAVGQLPPATKLAEPLRSRVATITGADDPVDTVARRALGGLSKSKAQLVTCSAAALPMFLHGDRGVASAHQRPRAGRRAAHAVGKGVAS